MASVLKVDKLDPQSGTALEIGTSGDTVTVPSGATLTLTSATLNLPTTITSTTEVKTNKISPATGTAFALGDSGDTFTVPSGATIVNSGTATGFGITAASFLPNAQPIFINGSMNVAQRATSATGITGEGYQTCDRMLFLANSIGTYTVIQETLTSGNAYANGFQKAFRVDCTTADASPAAADFLIVTQRMEGQNLQMFKKGTANAETYTLAFWIKSNKTGVGNVNLKDEDNTRQVGGTYTISAGDTWEHKIVTFAADTSGVLGDDNGRSMDIEWWLDSGSNYNSGTTDAAWGAETAADRNASGTLDIADNTSNDWAITGVQLEVGTYTSSTIPPFKYESIQANLSRCHRYYWIQTDNYGSLGTFSYYSTSRVEAGSFTFPSTMRAAPTLESSSGSAYFRVQRNGGDNNLNSFLGSNICRSTAGIYNTAEASGTAGHAGYGYARANGTLKWTAEL
jgi:hypothetical protein